MAGIASSTFALQSPPRERAAARRGALRQLKEMSEATMREEGLLNYAQAGLVLDVSTKRVSELVRLRKLTRFEFLGRTYVSLREVGDRLAQQIKAGRPKRSFGQRFSIAAKAVAQSDVAQVAAEAFPAKARRKRR